MTDPTPPYNLSEAQVAALRKTYDILAEHFDCHLICVGAKRPNDADHTGEVTMTVWNGGYLACSGLAIEASRDVHGRRQTSSRP